MRSPEPPKHKLVSDRPSPVPSGWGRTPDERETWTKDHGPFGMTVTFIAGEHWEWDVWSQDFPWSNVADGVASSRIAAMRKAELFIYMKEKVR